MHKNWYLVCTKPQRERKVAALLTKKKINSYYPLNRTVKRERNKVKIVYEPLFDSLVFVNIAPEEMEMAVSVDGVVNFVYWLQHPVMLKAEVLEKIQQFSESFSNISLGKIAIDAAEEARFEAWKGIDNNGGNGFVQKYNYRLLLPALGYTMIAEREGAKRDIFHYNQQSGIFSS